MEIASKHIRYGSRTDHFSLIPIGDIHLGNAGCDIDKLKETVAFIKSSPNTLACLMGDILECIVPNDPRFDPKSVDSRYRITDLDNLVCRQLSDALDILRPIKDKILFILHGNHEQTIRLRHYHDVTLDMARDLKIPYLGYEGFFKLVFERKPDGRKYRGSHTMYTIYASHGCGVSRSTGAKINRLEHVMGFIDCDIILLAHEHKKIISNIVRIGVKTVEDAMVERKQVGVMTGSFLKTYLLGTNSYGANKLYAPNDLGVIKIIMRPHRHDVHASL